MKSPSIGDFGDLAWLTARPIAHRGLHDLGKQRPENTLAAFAAAVAGDYAIECDLHPASDGVPMVFHDDRLERLTGEIGPVRDRDARALSKLKVLGTAERVPTLADLLALVDGRVPIVAEMKSVRGRNAGFAAKVAAMLRAYRGPAAAMSFDPLLLIDARRADARAVLGLTSEGGALHAGHQIASVVGLRLAFVSHAIRDLPSPQTTFVRKRLRRPLITWTIRTGAEREKAAREADQITFEGFLA